MPLAAAHPVFIGTSDGMALIVDGAFGLIGLGLLATLVGQVSVFRRALQAA